jgi:V/A-type H+-transporting ATPase subunit C
MKSGALYARAKCMYGKRLTREQYEALASRHSMSDLILYLKAETGYKDVLAGINENMLHYGQIEALIKRNLLREYQRLCALAFGNDRKLMDFILLRAEMMEILEFIMLLMAGRQGEYICGLPDLLRSRTKINFAGLASCTDYSGFMEALRGTHYYPTLSDFAVQSPIDFTQLELAITRDYYRRIQEMAKHIADARTRKAIQARYRVQVEIININRIIRMKRYFGYSSGDTRKNLIRLGKTKDSALVQALVEADADSLDAVMENSRFGGVATSISNRDPERICYTLIYRRDVRVMYDPTPTVEAALAYIDLKEIEMRNIITIVEGIRYGLSVPKIMEYLVM